MRCGGLGTRWCTTPCLRTYVYIRWSCSPQLRVFTAARQTDRQTPLHSLTACTEIRAMWEWTRGKLATVLRTGPKHMLTAWVSAPIFIFATPQASDSVMDHRSRGTTLCRQKTILQPGGRNGLYGASKWHARQRARMVITWVSVTTANPARSTAARLLGLRVRFPPVEHLSLVSVVYCQSFVRRADPSSRRVLPSVCLCVCIIECGQVQQWPSISTMSR